MKEIARRMAPVVALAALAPCAMAQNFPSKPIRILTTSASGTPGDVLTRLVASKMSVRLNQPVVVEARPGAGGTLAAAEMVRAPHDGHTLLFTSNMIVVSRHLLAKSAVDIQTELLPLSHAAEALSFVVVHAAVAANNVRELVEYARANPGKLSFGTNGNGSALHLTGEAFKLATGTDFLHVPYSGATQGTRLNDFFSGRIPLDWSAYNSIRGYVGSGKIKTLAVLDRTRFKALPDVPAITEIYPDYEFSSSYWLYMGPMGLPAPVLARLEQELQLGLRDPETVKRADDMGIKAVGSNSKEAVAYYKSDLAITEKLAKIVGLKPQ
ncbi:MAG: Bug family tripartite tricarboxylate transporter substrate binding protein [Burkholderiales bacterium]